LTQMDRIEARIDSIEKNLIESNNLLSSRIDSIEQNLKESNNLLSSRIESIEENLKESNNLLSSRIESIEENVNKSNNSLSSRMDSIEQKLSLQMDSIEQKLSSIMIENDKIKEDLKESNNKLSLMMENLQFFMNEMKDNSLNREMNQFITPLECFRCHETYTRINNSKCRYHDGSKFSDRKGDGWDISDKRWSCCKQYYFKLLPGHSRTSNNDLMTNEKNSFIPDHSTGCRERDYHESR